MTADGPTDLGNMLRLSYGDGNESYNSIAFDRTHPGTFEQMVADFTFRIQPGTGRAGGFGFTLLNTANYGLTGTVTPSDVAEEPNFTGSLGVGFDIYQSDAGHLEVNDNHLSIHYDGKPLHEIEGEAHLTVTRAGVWIRLRRSTIPP